MEAKCSHVIYRRSHPHQCKNTGRVERDGKPFCWAHDPVGRKERQERRDSIEQARWAENRRRDAGRARAVLAVKEHYEKHRDDGCEWCLIGKEML